VTEIPEHLLKRSRERRAALGGDDAEGGSGDAPASSAPAKVESSAPAAAAPAAPAGRAAVPESSAPPPPKPDTPVVAAYKRRKRIPFWAMTALSVLPVWALLYARAVTEQPEEASGPMGVGAEVYGAAGCSGCHGAGGGGGAGYAFTGGEVLSTFPNIEDQLRYVYFGTSEYNLAGVEVYGNPDREGGAHVTGGLGVMPGFGGVISDAEILAVVCHERYTLGGADPTGEYADEFETWCAEESELWVEVEGGTALATLGEGVEGVTVVGDAPIPGSPG
jgi:hypothetical protein